MMFYLYTMYDVVAETYSAPNMASSDGVVIRDLESLISLDPKFRCTAKDLRLFCVATFDAHSGDITPVDRRLVVDVKDLIKEE